MKNPVELLQSRLDEINKEFLRVYRVEPGSNSGNYAKKFNELKKEDLAKILIVINDYKNCIQLLKEITNYEYLKE